MKQNKIVLNDVKLTEESYEALGNLIEVTKRSADDIISAALVLYNKVLEAQEMGFPTEIKKGFGYATRVTISKNLLKG